jgi:isopentenyldiphosphate isomerase
MDELFPLIDQHGKVIGKASRSACHNGSKLLHPVVHLHIFNQKGEWLLQKRSAAKDIQPGKWDTSVGGHVNYGESVAQALRREAREELGIQAFEPVFVHTCIFESDVEKEKVYTYRTQMEGPFTINASEIEEIRFWTEAEILQNLNHSLFTPNFEHEFLALRRYPALP